MIYCRRQEEEKIKMPNTVREMQAVLGTWKYRVEILWKQRRMQNYGWEDLTDNRMDGLSKLKNKQKSKCKNASWCKKQQQKIHVGDSGVLCKPRPKETHLQELMNEEDTLSIGKPQSKKENFQHYWRREHHHSKTENTLCNKIIRWFRK